MNTDRECAVRGSEASIYDPGIYGRIVRYVLTGMLATALLVPAVSLWRDTTAHEWRVLGLGTLARVKLAVGFSADSDQVYEWNEGQMQPMPLTTIAADPETDRARKRFLYIIGENALLGLRLGAAGAAGGLALFAIVLWRMEPAAPRLDAEPKTLKRVRRLFEPVSGWFAKLRFSTLRRRACRIAGMPYPKGAETRHTIVSGAKGSGRTVLISDLIGRVRSRGERCIVYDRTGLYAGSFYDPSRDVLLNPLDARSRRWSPFVDASEPRGFAAMAGALIPEDYTDPFRALAARQLFVRSAGLFSRKNITGNKDFIDFLLNTDPGSVVRTLNGGEGRISVDPLNPEIVFGVRSMLSTHLAALRLMGEEGKPFSIRNWIAEEHGDGCLFMTSHGEGHSRLKGILSAWIEIAMNAHLSFDPDKKRGIWIILDDLPSLHRLPGLLHCLGEARHFGVRFVLGLQSVEPLRALYGGDGAETISGLCGTRAVMAASDDETALWSSASLNGGTKRLAREWQIRSLRSLNGYLKFPGPHDGVKIALDDASYGRHRPRASARLAADPRQRDQALWKTLRDDLPVTSS